MAIADQFDHEPDAGFVRSYDARAARRQFQVSVVLVVVLLVATLAVAFLVRNGRPSSAAERVAIGSTKSVFAETLLDAGN